MAPVRRQKLQHGCDGDGLTVMLFHFHEWSSQTLTYRLGNIDHVVAMKKQTHVTSPPCAEASITVLLLCIYVYFHVNYIPVSPF